MQHILLVDDNLTSLKQAAALLKDTYKVSMVKSGSQALEFLEKFTPNLILLDIEMPQMDGFETIQRIKLDERFRKIPVIVLTGDHDTATETKGFEYGAVDFITKPYSQEVMLHRVSLQMELAEYQVQLENMIEKRTEKLLQTRVEMARMTAELDVARRVQTSMLPKGCKADRVKDGFSICAGMKPAKEVGGDFFDYFKVDDNHAAVVIADVSGKGVPAALFMVVAKTLIKTKTKEILSPGKILEEVNNEICENNEEEMFVTLFLGIVEISTGKVVCANAGHNPPIKIKADGPTEYLSVEKNFVLGAMPQIEFLENELYLEHGDWLFLYTDGVTEAVNEKNEFFGEERLLKILQTSEIKGMIGKDFLSYVKKEVETFVGNTEQADDITMLVFQYT